jgi:Protein of unknown function (DUF642)
VTGSANSILLNRSVTIQGTTSTFVWAPQTFTFTANSTTSIIILSDGSSTGAGTDLFVDNVRVRSGTLAPSIMTVNTTPDAGKSITVNTPDLAGQGNGMSNFTRAYATGTTVQMVAPHVNFVKWLKNGQWYATNQSISVVVDANVTMTAVYTTTPVLGPFTNGSWTWTGSQQSVKVKDGLPTTDGLIIVEFNSNNSGVDGAISQTFTTTAGTTYSVAFDMGTKAFNTAQQRLRARVLNGATSLFDQSYTINGIGNGDVIYAAKTFTFTATGATSTLIFSDQSSSGAGLDLLLDNVRINPAAPGKALATAIKAPAPVVRGAPAPTSTSGGVTLTSSVFPNDEQATTSTEIVDGAKYLVLTVTKPAFPADVKQTVEVSSDLIDWFSGENHTTVLIDNAGILKVRDNTPLDGQGKRYIRLRTTTR